jgi:hypothetical protein
MSDAQIIPIRRSRAKGRRSAGLLGPHDQSPQWSGTPAAPDCPPLQDPIEFAMRFMLDPAKPDALRVSMAKAAMQYMYGPSAPMGGYDARARSIARLFQQALGDIEPAAPAPTHTPASSNLADAAADVVAANAAMEARIRLLEERARAAETRARDIAHAMDEQAAGLAARLQEMEQRTQAAEAIIANIKAVRPDVFDESDAVVPPGADAQEWYAQLTQLEEHVRTCEERATQAEGSLREAERRARDMEQRACAAEALIARFR